MEKERWFRLILVLSVIVPCLIVTAKGEVSLSYAEDKSNENSKVYTAEVLLEYEQNNIILIYPDGTRDTLKGESVGNFIRQSPELNRKKALVNKVEFTINAKACTMHNIFVYDFDRTRLTTVSCE